MSIGLFGSRPQNSHNSLQRWLSRTIFPELQYEKVIERRAEAVKLKNRPGVISAAQLNLLQLELTKPVLKQLLMTLTAPPASDGTSSIVIGTVDSISREINSLNGKGNKFIVTLRVCRLGCGAEYHSIPQTVEG